MDIFSNFDVDRKKCFTFHGEHQKFATLSTNYLVQLSLESAMPTFRVWRSSMATVTAGVSVI